ncbi:winged helix-turn-helix transcriptional regulator [Methanocella arvoryzae]|uniref:Pyrrolo-quinoline quinone repeat domain-containing protein n=1 Tax=Methanocella arvoryzae (strain DSM 22066 / NBRC 105507 / MRE50) TaxID=351160 RepID=Q0W536_METAR|nr:winged helix-turn-helix transcriptional regulator [Methanocella arvoryzae]CAJ36507.1 hypothetical protein RCIX1200 [Methanocella arvoryzae MRE50]
MERAKTFEATVVLSIILLGAMLVTMVAAGGTEDAGNWSTSSINATPYMYTGHDDTLYLFNDYSVKAIDRYGKAEWSYNVPEPWTAIGVWSRKPEITEGNGLATTHEAGAVFADDEEMLYLYLQRDADIRGMIGSHEKVVALRNGREVWDMELNGSSFRGDFDDAWIQEHGDCLYIFHSYSLDVVGKNGEPRFRIDDVSDPPAIGPDGEIYLVKAVASASLSTFYPGGSFRGPSGTVEAYYPNGSLWWRSTIEDNVTRQAISRAVVPDGGTLPLCRDNVLYLPVRDGLVAMDTGGEVKWKVRFDENVTMLQSMPFGPDGIAYMQSDNLYVRPVKTSTHVYAISKDGKSTNASQNHPITDLAGASDGIAYYAEKIAMDSHRPGLESLMEVRIVASDLRTGQDIWSLEVPAARLNVVVADEQNVFQIFEYPGYAYASLAYNEQYPDLATNPKVIFDVQGKSLVSFIQGRNVSYVSYYCYNYEYPIAVAESDSSGRQFTSLSTGYEPPESHPALFNRSRFCYASGIAALDRNGTILWNRPLDSRVAGIAIGNSTIYYGTNGGGLTAISDRIALGLTVTAALYLFFRFFLVGAVFRARNRLDNNENRQSVLRLVRDKPGSTMYDVARDLNMNLGTLRYHLLVLCINHKVREHRDGKYVRYFPGTQTFTPEELEVMSLLRREPVRRLMSVLCEKPGISNAEIARALGISESAVSSYMRDLSAKGFVDREMTPSGRTTYVIRKERLQQVEHSLEIGG